MKTWQDLSPEQKQFLKSFLKTSIRDVVRSKYKTETNKGIIAAFGKFSDLEALFDQRAALIPDDYTEKTFVLAQAATARARKIEGAFDEATQRMAPAIQAAERLRDELTAAADALRNEVGAIKGVGFTPAALAAIEQARQTVLGHLADPLPTQAQMNAARDALAPFEAAINTAYEQAGDVPAASAALERAAGQAADRLAEVATLDTNPFASAPQAGALAAAVQKAKDLQAAIAGADQADAVAMRALAGALLAWLTKDEAATLVAEAKLAVIAQVQAAYGSAKPDIDAAIAIDPAQHDSEPETAQLKTTHAEIKAENLSHLATLATDDLQEILKLTPLIEATRLKCVAFSKLASDVDVRVQTAKYKSLGAGDAHAAGMVKLLGENEEAGKAVIASLQRNRTILNGQEATRTFIETKETEAKRLATELKTLEDEWGVLNADFNTKLVDYNTKNDAHAAALERVTQLGAAATDQDRAAVETARLALAASRQIAQPAHTAKKAKADDYRAKKAEGDTANTVLKAAKNQRAMLNAVTFGPLSPVAAHPIPPDMLADVVKLFDKNGDLANETCALARNAKDPQALAQTALFMADQCETGFAWQPPAGSDGTVPPPTTMYDENALQYAKNALKQTAYFGADFAAEAQVAAAAGIPHKQNAEMRTLTDYGMKNVAAVRATQAAEAMIQRGPDGAITLDVNGPAFNDMLMERRHGFDAMFQPTVTLTEQMGNLQDFFGDPDKGDARRAEAEVILNSVTAVPTSKGARRLLQQQMGIPKEDFDDPTKADEIKEKIQIGILKAMSTPVAQGDVGSCFATAPLRKLQHDDPVALMEMYRDIATEGVFKPKHGRPVLAVTKLPPGDEPLARSLEYSIATAAARTQNSRQHDNVNNAMFNPAEPTLGGLKDELSLKSWRKLEPQLQQAVIGGYTFIYDPLKEAGATSSDGSSSKGFYKMFDIKTKTEITSQAEFVAFIKRKAAEAVKAAKLKDSDHDTVMAYIDEPAFVKAVDKLASIDKPWAMQFGGWSDTSGAVLFEEEDGTKRPENLRGAEVVSEDASDTTRERAVKVLKSLASLGGGDMTMVSTGALHAFNALQPDGVFAALNDPPGFDANVKAQLVDPGRKIATEKLPQDRATYLYNKRIDSVVPWAHDDAERDLIRAAYGTPPTTDMTPAELESFITTKLEPWKTASSNRKATEWAGQQTTPPAQADIDTKKAELLDAENAAQKKAVTSMMAAEMGVPEFVIADSNWGSEADKALFVIAPDPLTGEPRMWSKWAVGGSMSPMDDKWLNTNWMKDE